ncbi:MAG: hypothetical protein Q9187_001170 [Circinaria calcarea]
MVATTGTHPRRKPATYGKPSRNPMLGCRGTASDAGVGDMGDGSKFFEGSIPGRIRKEGFIISGPHREQCNPKAKSQLDLTAEAGMEEEGLLYQTAPKSLSGLQDEQAGSLYDVPSSGEEQDYALRGVPSKKKRKICRISARGDSGVVYDDDSLQRHIAAEVDHINHVAPCPIGLTRHHNPTRVPARKSNSASRPKTVESIRVPSESCFASSPDDNLWRTKTRSSSAEHWITSKSDGSLPYKKSSDSRSAIRTADASLIRAKTLPLVSSTTSDLETSCHQAHQRPRDDLEEFPSPGEIGMWNSQITHLPQSSAPTYPTKDGYSQNQSACPVAPKSLRTKLVDRFHRMNEGTSQPVKYDSGDERLESKDSAVHMAHSHDVQHAGKTTEDATSGSNPHSPGNRTQDVTHTDRSNPVPGIHFGSLKVTYARQRSYLTEDEINVTATFSKPSNPDLMSNLSSAKTRDIEIASQVQPPQDQYSEMGDSEDGQSGTIRSIHELREAGGNARLAGEMEAILEDIYDIPSAPLSLQRSSLLELAMKLEKSSFRRSFIDRGLEGRLLARIGCSPDTIVNMLLMVSFVYILAEPGLPHTLDSINNQRTVDYLGSYLKLTDDLVLTASSRKSNLSKAKQLDISRLCDSLLGSPVWTSGRPLHVTARNLSLQCLEYLVRHVREAGCASGMLSQNITTALVDIMVPSIPHSISAGTALELQLAVSILESTIASRGAANYVETVWTSESTTKIAHLLSIIQTWSGYGFGRLRTSALRLSLNLTNNNLSPCEAFSKPEMINATMAVIISGFHRLSSELPANDQMEVIDNLILALGLLINLAEWSETARMLFVTTHIDGKVSLDAFHLSLNKLINERVCSQLQGGTLQQLLRAVEEFIQYHRQVEDEICHVERAVDLKAGFTNRLQAVVDRLRREDVAA